MSLSSKPGKKDGSSKRGKKSGVHPPAPFGASKVPGKTGPGTSKGKGNKVGTKSGGRGS